MYSAGEHCGSALYKSINYYYDDPPTSYSRMIDKLHKFLKGCNILRKHFICILHHLKIQEASLLFIVPYSRRVLLLLAPSLGEGQYRSLSREKQFATRRVLHWFTVGCGWPKSFSYYNASDTHHVRFTYKNDPPEAWNLSQKSLTGRGVRLIGGTVQSLYFLSWTTVKYGKDNQSNA